MHHGEQGLGTRLPSADTQLLLETTMHSRNSGGVTVFRFFSNVVACRTKGTIWTRNKEIKFMSPYAIDR